MFRNLLFYFCAITLLSSTNAFANQEPKLLYPVSCSLELKKQFDAILKVPEARKLIAAIQKEGRFSISTNNDPLSKQFGAFWDFDDRIVAINLLAHESEGRIIGSIIFELHNAVITSKLDRLHGLATSRKISKSQYVEAVEKLEYENSIKAAQVAEIGIKMGLFPKSARLPTYNSFNEHFYFQKKGGHSAWIAANYEHMAS